MVTRADIDIDVPDRAQVLDLITHTRAMMRVNGVPRPHNSGIYVTGVPRDAINDCCAIDYEEAERRGYFKIDILNQSVYQLVQSPEHLDRMLAQEPDWSRLWQDQVWFQQLVHIGRYWDLATEMQPDSIPRMAAFISVIRPGKAHLQRRPWPEVFESVWDGDGSAGFVFKKSHAISYAHLVALHMNLTQGS